MDVVRYCDACCNMMFLVREPEGFFYVCRLCESRVEKNAGVTFSEQDRRPQNHDILAYAVDDPTIPFVKGECACGGKRIKYVQVRDDAFSASKHYVCTECRLPLLKREHPH